MTDSDRLAALEAERDRLQATLDASYAQLSEVTTRMLAMNEAADSLVQTHDGTAVAVALLEVTALPVGARVGGVFLSRGEGAFDLLSAIGLDEEGQESLESSLPDIALCQLAEQEGRTIHARSAGDEPAFAEWRAEALAADPSATVEPVLALFIPLVLEDRTPGILALGALPGGRDYREEERLFLEHIARQGALALDRAILFESNQDRLRDLDALLRVSRELASTLDLDHVMVTAVNLTSAIAPRERAILALFEGGKLRLRAVSDFPRIDASTTERLGLARVLEWFGYRKPETLHLRHSEVEADPEHEGRDVWMEYFAGEMRGVFALLLKDDQGPVGVLMLEAYDERAFDRDSDREALAVLVGQLSTAIRNAELYRQLPMVSALTPLAARRRAWLRMEPAQRLRVIAAIVVALLLVGVVPWPVAVGGDGQVLPAAEVPVRAAIAGRLEAIAVRAGERVVAGQPMARIDPGAIAPRLAALRAEAERALYAGAAAGERGDPIARRIADLERQEALARLSSADRADRRTHLTSPIEGMVLTPGLAELEGAWLEIGDVFCQVSTLDTLRVEVGISEADIGRVHPGQPIRLKVLAFPDRQFRGQVTEIAFQGEATQPGRPTAFKVIGWVANPGPALKSGMTGRARIDVGRETFLSRASRGLWRWIRLSFFA